MIEDISLPTGAWVLLGDGRKALFLRNTGTPMNVQLVTERVLQQENPRTGEQGSDQPGRYLGPDGAGRSAMEETDWHQLAEDRFAHEIAVLLYQGVHAHRIEQLVVVAPPKVLGRLRGELRSEVAKCVIAEVSKDLTGHPISDVNRILSRTP